ARRLLKRADRAPSDENVAALRDALADREAELTLPEAVELAADV
ncbi:homocitrate synthase, partial [Halobacterium sp. PCN9]|nr:homocitrate synthase [Halobacterium bonnevillei]